MIAKSKTPEQHIEDLRKLFTRLRKYRLRLNPAKCTFGVKTGKLLGFIVNEKGIEVDPDKVKAIREMPTPRTEAEVRGFLGRINFIARFISQLTATCTPIFKLLRKKHELIPGRPLILYLTVLEESMGCMLGQRDDTGKKEHAIYYLSKKFTDCEQRYSALERTCCALVWATKRLRQYMLAHTVWLIAKTDPIKYIFEKPALTGRIARWQMALSEYDIVYISQKAIKGRNGIGVVLVSPKDQCFPFSAKLGFDCTNNMAEYEACTMGLLMAAEHQAKQLKVFGDSALVIYQLRGEWETRDAKLVPYHEHIRELIDSFDTVTFHHVPREENQMADALATLSAMVQVNEGQELTIHVRQQPRIAYCQYLNIEPEETNLMFYSSLDTKGKSSATFLTWMPVENSVSHSSLDASGKSSATFLT
ncbi:Retrovirus-related Pol polyprotein, partial [Mucuna pruriens]